MEINIQFDINATRCGFIKNCIIAAIIVAGDNNNFEKKT